MKWKLELITFQNNMTWVWKSVIWQLTFPRLSLPLATSGLWFSCPGLKTLTNVFHDAGSDLIMLLVYQDMKETSGSLTPTTVLHL